LLMLFAGHINFFQVRFVEIGLGGFVVLALVAALGYTPTLTKQIAVLDSDGWDSPAYKALDVRSRTIGIVLAVLVLVLVAVMVVKPQF
jgi:hypothetical protein